MSRCASLFRRFLQPLTDVCSTFSSSGQFFFYFIEPNICRFFREIRDEESFFLHCTNHFQKTSSKVSQTVVTFTFSHKIRIPSISGCLLYVPRFTIINIKVFQRYLIGTLSYMTSLSTEEAPLQHHSLFSDHFPLHELQMISLSSFIYLVACLSSVCYILYVFCVLLTPLCRFQM